MDKPSRMPQVYGYLVCLVTVITFLICASTLVYAILDLGDPIHAGFQGSPSLASFEIYRMDVLKSLPKEAEAGKSAFALDEQTLRAMYEAAKEDKIQTVRHEANRTIMIDAILIAICAILFVTHWRWMKKLARVKSEE